ncbi:hypothetical protein KGF51_14765 [Clostridioides sp. ZZV14-6045]|uniref:hypothetical protein n=1 Tax=Clostridioides sp. ZZV14-6045 TaxID=2811489 RepID=UPI001D123A76|nr:hypothetical protein [Clostridioides sp. ZZV14-6045]
MNDFDKVSRFSSYLKFVQVQPFEMCLMAVKKDGFAIKHIRWDEVNFSDQERYKLYLEAVKENGLILGAVDFNNLTRAQRYEICLEAVKQNGFSIFSIEWEEFYFTVEEKRTICLETVKQNKEIISYFNWDKININNEDKKII